MRTPPKPRGATRKVILPDPLLIGRLRYWRLGAIRKYLAEVAGEPAPAQQADDEHLMQAKELRRMLGGVSDMWIHRYSRRDTERDGAAA
jgi:hypothetical protein